MAQGSNRYFSATKAYSRTAVRLYDVAAREAKRARRPVLIDDIVGAILSERDTFAYETLKKLRVSPDSLRAELQAAVAPKAVRNNSPQDADFGRAGASREARRAVVIAYTQARNFGHAQVRTDHFLLGCLLEGSSEAARVVELIGVDPYTVSTMVIQRGDNNEGPSAVPPGAAIAPPAAQPPPDTGPARARSASEGQRPPAPLAARDPNDSTVPGTRSGSVPTRAPAPPPAPARTPPPTAPAQSRSANEPTRAPKSPPPSIEGDDDDVLDGALYLIDPTQPVERNPPTTRR